MLWYFVFVLFCHFIHCSCACWDTRSELDGAISNETKFDPAFSVIIDLTVLPESSSDHQMAAIWGSLPKARRHTPLVCFEQKQEEDMVLIEYGTTNNVVEYLVANTVQHYLSSVTVSLLVAYCQNSQKFPFFASFFFVVLVIIGVTHSLRCVGYAVPE